MAVVGPITRATPIVAPRPRTDLETASWRMLRDEWAADTGAIAEWQEWERNRTRVHPQLRALLDRFLSGNIGLEQFRATFDRRTRTDWDAFALKGASGAMFLNALVKHTRHPIVLARQLRAALRLPSSVQLAAAQVGELVTAVAPPSLPLDPVENADTPAANPAVAPAHTVFFATMGWHLQAPDQWPAFQPSSRRVLRDEEDLFTARGEPAHDYLVFREAFLSLASGLSLTTWQLEHLCWWHDRRTPCADDDASGYNDFVHGDASRRRSPPRRSRAANREPPRLTTADQSRSPSRLAVRESLPPYLPFSEAPVLDHTHVQWLLAKVGKQLGCRVWIAANDWRKAWGGETLGALSVRTLPPLGLTPDSQRLVSLIDVVWLSGVNQVAAAFEVEHTTSVYSGLLRMADLAALSPNLSFPLYVVAPAARLPKVRRELVRPTFRSLELDRRCRFFSSESLLKALPSLARWANGPEAMEKLAEVATAD